MNFFNAKKIIKGIAFVVIAFLPVFGVNAMRGGGMPNECSDYKCSDAYKSLDSRLQMKIDIFYERVSTILKRDKVRNRINNFRNFLESVNYFLSDFDDNPVDKASVAKVIGILNVGKNYIVNMCLLRDFIQLSKSSINGRFSSLGYSVQQCLDSLGASAISRILMDGHSYIRHWTARVPKVVSTTSAITNTGTVPLTPITTDKPSVTNKQNNENEELKNLLENLLGKSREDPFEHQLEDSLTILFDDEILFGAPPENPFDPSNFTYQRWEE